MRRPLIIVCLFWSLLIVLEWGGHECCVKEEKMALLNIKAFFMNINSYTPPTLHHKRDDTAGDDTLTAWVDKGDDTDCCRWERVSCDPTTGRVTDLTLNYLVHGITVTHLYVPVRNLNVSLFSPFEELVNLELSGNFFRGCLPNQCFDKLIHLKKLKALNLAYNHFHEGHILRSIIGSLTSLSSFNLSFNAMNSNVSLQELLSNLTNLEMLDLEGNLFHGSLAVQDGTLFRNLKVLDLSGNSFEGCIPLNTIGNLSALVALSLACNFRLNGTLPNKEFCKLKNLEELDLSHNHFEGVLPPCFSNLSSLRVLDLTANLFKGEISFIFPNLKSLEFISLGHNHFGGKFSFSLLANHSKVKLVEIVNNGNLEVESEDSNWTIPKFQLEVLVLSGCNLNQQSGNVPTFLKYQSKLIAIDLSHNNMRGNFPNWVIKNNSKLQILNLRNNSLIGQLHLQLSLNTSIVQIDVSDNQINGKLQENLGRILQQIVYLNLSRNHFIGFVPSSFCNLSQLVLLDLSYNYFIGEIPKGMVSGCLGELVTLILSDNKIHGQIFSTHFNMTKLEILSLEENKFSGPISNGICRSQYLRLLDASNNQFLGELGSWISNITYLPINIILIRNNSLTGRLPCKIAIDFLLDVSHNYLLGPLPSCPFKVEHLLIQSNEFSGSIPETLLNSSSLCTLDVRDNNLSGEFPPSIGAKYLRNLLLGGNQLSGLFPNQLCRLQNLKLIDLSNNHLSGQIPRCINHITFEKSTYYENYLLESLSFHVYWSTCATTYGKFLIKKYWVHPTIGLSTKWVIIDFVAKRISMAYKGGILKYMSGLDFSFNNFTGEIPCELGELNWIHVLNLSHNQIKGVIPKTFSGLKQLETLDLSYNNLSGMVPIELMNLNFLAVFSVAHNNLSGRLPEMKGQFGTFDQSSYEGNPYLCGAPLAINCSHMSESPSSSTTSELTSETKWYEVDMLVLWVAFTVSYVIFFLGVIISLYVNPSWRIRWFNFLDDCYYMCYYKFCM